MKIIHFVVIILGISSCARVQTLNMVKHVYSERPKQIVWFQIPGLTEEHLALLKFNSMDSLTVSNLEAADCIGKMWSYNLFHIRPEASLSFLSQMSGSKNITSTCGDTKSSFVWDEIEKLDYKTGVLEAGIIEDSSLSRLGECNSPSAEQFKKIRLWKMTPAKNIKDEKYFHYQDLNAADSQRPGVYYDKSCQNNLCFSSTSNNFKKLWIEFTQNDSRSLFILRDFNFMQALKKKDMTLARESLVELERSLNHIKSEKRSDVLVLITSAETINLEFPMEGKNWAEFLKSGKNLNYKNTSLVSPVFAFGPMSENFCGMFEESEIFKRILLKSEKKVLDWDLINPF